MTLRARLLFALLPALAGMLYFTIDGASASSRDSRAGAAAPREPTAPAAARTPAREAPIARPAEQLLEATP